MWTKGTQEKVNKASVEEQDGWENKELRQTLRAVNGALALYEVRRV